MSVTLVIGFGNMLRADDAVGPMAAERLGEIYADQIDRHVRVLSRQTLTPELAADIAEADRVIFLDASAESEAGEIIQKQVSANTASSVAMVHFLDPQGLLCWAKQLYGCSPEATLITVGGESFHFGVRELTATAEAALDEMVKLARRWIERGALLGSLRHA